MQPFVKVTGVVAPLLLNNIDTDQITPGRTGMKVQKSGFAEGLFSNWRYMPDGSENSDFILNQPSYRQARFLIAGVNFGCGSSREFAVWALRDFGIRAVIASSFGSIFTSNCYMNGVIPISLHESAVESIAAEISSKRNILTVDLEKRYITSPLGHLHEFSIPELQRERLLDGLDVIDVTIKREPLIAEFQAKDALKRPWIYDVPNMSVKPL